MKKLFAEQKTDKKTTAGKERLLLMPMFHEIATDMRKEIATESQVLRDALGFVEDCFSLIESQLARERSAYAAMMRGHDEQFPNLNGFKPAFNSLCSQTQINMEALFVAFQNTVIGAGKPMHIVEYVEVSSANTEQRLFHFHKVAMINYFVYELRMRVIHQLATLYFRVRGYLQLIKNAVNLINGIAVFVSAGQLKQVGEAWSDSQKHFAKAEHQLPAKEVPVVAT